MTTAIARTPRAPLVEPTEFEARLALVSKLLSEASTDEDLQNARDAALMIQKASAILKHRGIQAQASALVNDAERAIAKNNPAIPPEERNPSGRNGAGENTNWNATYSLPRHTLSRLRSAHSGLPDEQYETLRQRSIENEEPLTRDRLIAEATKARLAANKPGATRLVALRWEGGKAITATQGTGTWILSLLPYDPTNAALYAEPFAGMLSVLLNRPKSHKEIVNDTNRRVTNFWTVLRRWPGELERQLKLTPYAEAEFYECLAHLDNGTPMERARAFCVVVGQGVLHSDRANSNWALTTDNTYNKEWPIPRRIPELKERMDNVRIACRPAEHLLGRLEKCPHAVIYCDPPYPDVSEALYSDHQMDMARIGASLNRQEGRVAVSGNPGDWDAYLAPPQWTELSRKTFRSTTVSRDGKITQDIKERIEVLWVNYDPETHQRLPV